jgi:MOSC domain-containing protein YiiM
VLLETDSNLDEIRASPTDDGSVELIARRPAENEREVLDSASVDTSVGLVGDNWLAKAEAKGKGVDPDTQLTLMNARAAALFAGDRERWALAGDQLYVDLDLSYANLPPGTRLSVGEAVIEVTAVPHTGCGKFLRRFGIDAQKLVNSKAGRQLNLRGINARVVAPGTIRVGDRLVKLAGS